MPTVTLGDRSGTDYAGTADVVFNAGFPTTNYSSEASASPGNFLVKFTGLTSIPGPVTVTDAFITLYVTSGDSAADTMPIKRVLRDWVEAQATFNQYSSGNNWTTGGCLGDATDRVAANSCELSYAGGFSTGDRNTSSNTTLIADVEGIINGTLSNYGWWFRDPTGYALGMPANATAANRPLLTVTYTAAGGTQAPRSQNIYRQRRK